MGREFLRPFFLSPLCWEVVQLAVHQILDLIILVRVQALLAKLIVRVPESVAMTISEHKSRSFRAVQHKIREGRHRGNVIPAFDSYRPRAGSTAIARSSKQLGGRGGNESWVAL